MDKRKLSETDNNQEKNESKKIKLEQVEKNKEFNIIKNKINKKYQELNENEKVIKNIKAEIELLRRKLQENCNHKWEMCVVYGERTSYDCIYCNLNSRRGLL